MTCSACGDAITGRKYAVGHLGSRRFHQACASSWAVWARNQRWLRNNPNFSIEDIERREMARGILPEPRDAEGLAAARAVDARIHPDVKRAQLKASRATICGWVAPAVKN
jgi:Fe-S cluster biosynthesis and repair protein YggX